MPFWKKTLIFIGLSIVLLILFNSFIMPWYVRHDTLVTVPPVTGLKYEDALKVLDDENLEGKQGDIRYDPSKPIGMIIEQNPPAGQTVKIGRRIYLIISGGEQTYDVPNIVGRTVREARFSLALRNLELQEVTEKPSAQYPSGIIIEQIEQPGARLKKGSRVGVVVSVGMDAGNIKVPDLTGKNIEEAKKLLLMSKLTIGKVTNQPSSSVPVNSVIDQYPRPNSLAKENDKVDVFINREVKKKVMPDIQEETFEGNVENDDFQDLKKQELPDKGEIPDDTPKDKKPFGKEKTTDKEKKPDIKKDNKPKVPDTKKPKEPEDKDGIKF